MSALLAITFGHISRRRSARAGRTVSGAAIVGLTLGYLGLTYLIWENVMKQWAMSALDGMD